ncbi:hypothetical protein MRX96_002928 [Rhipicephalus microplus]
MPTSLSDVCTDVVNKLSISDLKSVQDVLSGNTSSLQHVWSQVGITSTYVTSPSGALNALEVVSAASLFLLISTLGSELQQT